MSASINGWTMLALSEDARVGKRLYVVLDARAAPILLSEAQIGLDGTGTAGSDAIGAGPAEPPRKAAPTPSCVYTTQTVARPGPVEMARAAFAHLLMRESARAAVAVDTRRGRLTGKRAGDLVAVDMGAATLGWRDVPMAREMDTLSLPIEEGPLSKPAAVGMGNPHRLLRRGCASRGPAISRPGAGAASALSPAAWSRKSSRRCTMAACASGFGNAGPGSPWPAGPAPAPQRWRPGAISPMRSARRCTWWWTAAN